MNPDFGYDADGNYYDNSHVVICSENGYCIGSDHRFGVSDDGTWGNPGVNEDLTQAETISIFSTWRAGTMPDVDYE